MSTMNISLPQEHVNFVDSLVAKYGFANRSEFIRGVLRILRHKPDVLRDETFFPFEAPKERSVKKIMASFRKTKKYSEAFLKDLEEGLKGSTYFKP